MRHLKTVLNITAICLTLLSFLPDILPDMFPKKGKLFVAIQLACRLLALLLVFAYSHNLY